MSFVSPISLLAQVTLPAQAGELGLPDPTRLENPFQAPMWLDEIRFHIPYVKDGPNFVPLRWSNLFVKLLLGNIPITKGAVPLSLLCKQLNDSAVPDVNVGTPTEQLMPVTYNVYTWKLPKPLFIPARDFLRPVIYYAPSPTSVIPLSAVTVNVTYVCRPLPKNTPTPKKLQIPWVTYYSPPVMENFSDSLIDRSDQSTPSDLYNPFEQELHVQRFVGRFLNFQIGNSQTPDDNNYGDLKGVMTFADELVDFRNNVPLSGTFVSAQDSFNNILIRDPTPFYHVFDAIDRSWTVNCVLPPKGFYLFTVDRLWAYLQSEFDYVAAATVGIGMISWRDVFYAQRD